MTLSKDIENTLLRLCKEISNGVVKTEVTLDVDLRQNCEGYNLILNFIYNRNNTQFVFECNSDGQDEYVDVFVDGHKIDLDDWKPEYLETGIKLYNRWLEYVGNHMIMVL